MTRIKSILLAVAVVALVIGATVALSAQTFTEKNSFQVDLSIAIDIGETINVEGKTFPVYELKSGANFVKAISAKGSEYPVWIYEQTELTHKGYKVHKTTKDKYCYYKLNKSGYPYPVWLKLQ